MGLTRGIDPVLLAAISGNFNPVMLVLADIPGGAVRVHSGVGWLSWAGQSWLGVGAKGFISLPTEAAGAASFSGVLRLGGLPDAIDDYLNSALDGSDVDIWFGAVTERAGVTLIGQPLLMFSGVIDGVEDEQVFSPDGDSSRVISAGIASGPSQRSATSANHSYEDQLATYPDDTSLRWVKGAQAQTGAKLPEW